MEDKTLPRYITKSKPKMKKWKITESGNNMDFTYNENKDIDRNPGVIDFNFARLTNIINPVDDTDVATKNYVDNSIEKTLTEFYMNKIIILERRIQQLSEKINSNMIN